MILDQQVGMEQLQQYFRVNCVFRNYRLSRLGSILGGHLLQVEFILKPTHCGVVDLARPVHP